MTLLKGRDGAWFSDHLYHSSMFSQTPILLWTFAAILSLQPASGGGLADPAVASSPSPQAVAARAGVELCLRGLEHAALKADKGAWLAGIDHTDPEFLKEQTYFANDLSKKPPEAMTLNITDLKVSDGSARGTLTFHWNMPGKRERHVSFEAGFVEHDGTWLYTGEAWERHQARGVIVLHDPGLAELAERTVRAFESVRGKVEAGFELSESPLATHTQKIKLYASMRHLQQSICLSYSDGLSGWNEPDESVKLLANRNSGVNELRALLAHEYGHVATFALGPHANEMPWWIEEGVAELSREGVVGGELPTRQVEQWARMGTLAPWSDLADFENCPPRLQGYVYVQGHHMLGYISDQFGRHKRNWWLTLMAQGKKLDEATREALGRPFAQLDEEWRGSLPGRVAPPALPPEQQPPMPQRAPGEAPISAPGLDHPAPDEVPK